MRDTTPLHAACEKGHTETAQMLIDRGANVNKENRVCNILELVCIAVGWPLASCFM